MPSAQEPGPYKRDIPEDAVVTAAPPPLQPPPAAPVTKLIVGLNVLVFVIMSVLSGGTQPDLAVLSQWGVDHGPQTLAAGQYFRILSSTFLHFNVLHIAFNMYALWSVGQIVESLYGSSKFLFIYLVAGALASLTSLYFHPQLMSAGASGAVFGAFGALLVFLRIHAASFERSYIKSATGSIVVLLIVNLMWGLSTPGIDNFAHVGGFIFGALAGMACLPASVNGRRAWSIINLVSAAVLVSLCYFGYKLDETHYDSSLPAYEQAPP